MFYIPHGTTKIIDNKQQQFDARTYQWKNVPTNTLAFSQYTKQESGMQEEWFNNNCHPEGLFFCNRCYRKHYVPDNFDLLCDGCTEVLKDYHSQGFSFDFTDQFNLWYTNIPQDVIEARIELRQALDDVYKAEKLLYNGLEVILVKDLLKNKGTFEVCYVTDDINDKTKRFILNIDSLVIE